MQNTCFRAKLAHHDFLNPACLPTTLDIFLVRQTILDALYAQLENFYGIVLDIGCGNMPYRSLLLTPPSRASQYIGMDIEGDIYQRPDVCWDGHLMPFENDSIDCTMATEVLEHCPEPEVVMREAWRVLKSGGRFFFTVPFLWPLHDVPYDEYRYTPFALERHLRNVGFERIQLEALGGWDASLAQMIGFWVRRRPMSLRKRNLLSRFAIPVIKCLSRHDQPPHEFNESSMITGLSGTAIKPIP